jgi:hypothetical protein
MWKVGLKYKFIDKYIHDLIHTNIYTYVYRKRE